MPTKSLNPATPSRAFITGSIIVAGIGTAACGFNTPTMTPAKAAGLLDALIGRRSKRKMEMRAQPTLTAGGQQPSTDADWAPRNAAVPDPRP